MQNSRLNLPEIGRRCGGTCNKEKIVTGFYLLQVDADSFTHASLRTIAHNSIANASADRKAESALCNIVIAVTKDSQRMTQAIAMRAQSANHARLPKSMALLHKVSALWPDSYGSHFER
jgi:hypothetical protein